MKLFNKMTSDQKEMIVIVAVIIIITIVTMSIGVPKIKSIIDGDISIPKGLSKVEVVVEQGDNAWNIQKQLTPNSDIREMLYYGEIENGKSLGNIKPGETIVLFYEPK